MKSYNNDFYNLFNEIADLMSIQGEGFFRVRAYREAARVLREEAEPITKKNANIQYLISLPRIGNAIADKMIQYIKTGEISYLKQLRKEIPKPVRDMLKIPRLGPARVKDLYIKLGIKSKAQLKKCAMDGSISELKGFGDILVKSIIHALESGQKKKKRHKRSEVKPIANKIVSILKKLKGVKKVEIAGSYRRQSPTVGDIDILVSGKPVADKAEKKILKTFPQATQLASGTTKIAFVIFPENLQVDIRFVPEQSYGSALLYFTGSKDYNVMMRKMAINQECLLNEYGLFKDGEYIAGKTEKEVCKKLNLPYLEPKKRK